MKPPRYFDCYVIRRARAKSRYSEAARGCPRLREVQMGRLRAPGPKVLTSDDNAGRQHGQRGESEVIADRNLIFRFRTWAD
jgi:hypothetical protein